MCFSVYCRKLCSCLKGVDIRIHPLMILIFLSLAWVPCSAVELFLRYAAWDMGIAKSNLELLLFIIHTANIVLRTDKRIIGRRFDVGPFVFPGFRVFVVLLRFRAWFHLGTSLCLRFCCTYQQFLHAQLLVGILLVLC